MSPSTTKRIKIMKARVISTKKKTLIPLHSVFTILPDNRGNDMFKAIDGNGVALNVVAGRDGFFLVRGIFGCIAELEVMEEETAGGSLGLFANAKFLED